jgi:2-polyprenyl-6-methoxyphenol hydroxylase-like FAD-dependent oxidoreductase
MTEHMRELLAFGRDREATIDEVARHRSISRITLRHVLLNGLERNAHFNKHFLYYTELPDGSFQIHFVDGSTATADVLVGADGVNSGVRKQYLPHARPADTGVLTLGGKVPLTAGVMALAPASLLDGPVLVMPAAPCSLFMAMWKRSSRAQEPLRRLGIEEPIAGDEDYLILGFGARPEYLRLDGSATSLPGAALKHAMRHVVSSWHPNLRKLVELVDEKTIFATKLRTSQRPEPWKTTAVTLLGDAIHSMTPYRGVGANVALRDAALLCAKLREVHKDGKPLLAAIGEYEAAMRDYGFAAVEASRKSMEQAVGERSKRAFGMIKTAMRVVNAVPPLKRKLIPA